MKPSMKTGNKYNDDHMAVVHMTCIVVSKKEELCLFSFLVLFGFEERFTYVSTRFVQAKMFLSIALKYAGADVCFQFHTNE